MLIPVRMIYKSARASSSRKSKTSKTHWLSHGIEVRLEYPGLGFGAIRIASDGSLNSGA